MITSPAVIVQNIVAKHYGIQTAQLVGMSRAQRFAHPRQIAFWLCANVCGMGPAAIGRKFDRDHSTVSSGVHRAFSRMLSKPAVLADVNTLAALVRDACGLVEAFAVMRTSPTSVTFSMSYPRRVAPVVSRETERAA